MKTSVFFGRPAGIELRIHATFPLILIWAFWRGWRTGGPDHGLAYSLLVLALFVCVSFHELGHSLVARRFGIGTHRITLYPIGGVAALDRMPSRPHQELLMALGGPAVNLLIAAVLSAVGGGFPRAAELLEAPTSWRPWLALLIAYNVALAVFNLLPAFPMDGGRVFRSLLALFLPFPVATRVAAGLGIVLAAGLAAWGLFGGNPFLLVIAAFVAMTARRENAAVQIRSRLDRFTAGEIMRPDPPVLSPEDRLGRCLDLSAESGRTDFGVLHEGRLVGLLPDPAWRMALRDHGPDLPAGAVMHTRLAAVAPDMPLSRLVGLARRTGQPVFPVVRHGVLLGLLTQADLARHLVRASPPRHRPPDWSLDLG